MKLNIPQPPSSHLGSEIIIMQRKKVFRVDAPDCHHGSRRHLQGQVRTGADCMYSITATPLSLKSEPSSMLFHHYQYHHPHDGHFTTPPPPSPPCQSGPRHWAVSSLSPRRATARHWRITAGHAPHRTDQPHTAPALKSNLNGRPLNKSVDIFLLFFLQGSRKTSDTLQSKLCS